MVVLNGHFDGRQVVLDGPVPTGIPANTPVKVVFEPEPTSNGESGSDALAEIAKLARPLGLPKDFSEQHDHYVKGTPRR
jgi:hypothetical protein